MALRQAQALYRHLRALRTEYGELIEPVYARIANIILSYTNEDGQIQLERVRLLLAELDSELSSFFLTGGIAFNGTTPVSPFALLLQRHIDGVREAVLDGHVDWMRSKLSAETQDWLHQAVPTEVGVLNEFYEWENSKGRDLNQRVWALLLTMIAKLTRYILFATQQGLVATRVNKELQDMMYPSRKVKGTASMQGVDLSYDAMLFARMETTRAYTDIVFVLGALNTLSDGIEWGLSPRHPRMDICDSLATIGMGGERLRPPYPVDDAPHVVSDSHVGCICANWSSDLVASGEIERFEELRRSGQPPPFTPLAILIGLYLFG